jgi:hypothetical protein
MHTAPHGAAKKELWGFVISVATKILGVNATATAAVSSRNPGAAAAFQLRPPLLFWYFFVAVLIYKTF